MHKNLEETIRGLLVVVINDKDEILLMKRSTHKKYFPNRWSVVAAGPISKGVNLKEFALSEVRDETGVEGKFLLKGKTFLLDMDNRYWKITLYLVKIRSKNIVLNDEHTAYKWVKKSDLSDYDLIPAGKKHFSRILEKYQKTK